MAFVLHISLILSWFFDLHVDTALTDVFGIIDVDDKALAGFVMLCAPWIAGGRVILMVDSFILTAVV